LLWFLRDYPLAALLLRAATLALVSLLIGGLVFCTVLMPQPISSSTAFEEFSPRALRLLRVSAIGLAITQLLFIALDTAMLMSASGLGIADLYFCKLFSGRIAACLYRAGFSGRHPERMSA
jgi:hypothetical protein